MAGKGFGLGSILNRLLILGLIGLTVYLYWQNISLQKQIANIHGTQIDKQSSKNPWGDFNLTLPPGIYQYGSRDLDLINQARSHMQNAENEARAGNFGQASKDAQTADDDLKKAEADSSEKSRGLVTSLRSTVQSLQHKVHAAAQAFGSN
jgi:hypothetical protein